MKSHSQNILLFLLPFLLVCAGLCIPGRYIQAQELSNIGKSPVITTTGGISFNQVFYQSDDSLSQRDPYNYTISANLNFALYGWSIPLSILYTNKKWSYHQPFNQFSLHPSYKWVRLHIGFSSMNFSPYTLSGHQFLGGGIELSPGTKFRFSAMGGRLQKAILPDSLHRSDPEYTRIGSGFKAEYNLGFGSIAAIMFYAKDDENSLPFTTDSLPVSPMENITAGLSGNITVFKQINITLDYSSSTLTENTYSPTNNEGRGTIPGFRYRESTRHSVAFRTAINYNSIIGSIGLGYERVDPGYKTLGAYYNNSDFVNYTINYAGSLLKNRVTFGLSYGLMKDNLSGEKSQETKRRIGNINLGFTPVDKLNIALFYSNFNNYTNIRNTFEDINNTDPYDQFDTLDFTQISENMGANINLGLGNQVEISHNLSLSGSFQKATQIQEDNPANAGNSFYNAAAGYNVRIKSIDLAPGLMVNYSNSGPDTLKNEIFGPSFSIRKSFLDKKISSQIMVSYNLSMINKEKNGENTILRLSANYNLKKKHIFNASYVMAFRRSTTMQKRNESTFTITYRYSFGWTPFGKEKNNNSNNEATKEK